MIRFLFALIALAATLACGFLIGAHLLSVTTFAGAQATIAASIAAAVVAVIVPLLFAAKLARVIDKARPFSVTLGTLILWNGGIVAAGVFAVPEATKVALDKHGEWVLARAKVVEAPPPVPPVEAPVVTRTATVAVVPSAMTPRQIYAERADTVVFIRVQQKKTLDELIEPPAPAPSARLGKNKKRAKAKPAPPPPKLKQTTIESLGSGFIVSEDGVFVTNHHVIGSADRALVVLRDGTRFEQIEILALDPANDLALARITGATKKLRTAPLADRKIEVGEPAFAIGAPLGMQFTLTQGIVSAMRDFQGTRCLQMQTDVAPGSSGGPLLDEHGAVIGVNTAVRAPGLNLAVDGSHVKALLAGKRAPKMLERYVPGLEISALEIHGATIGPTARMNLEGVLQAAGMLADQCIEAVPEHAFISVRVDERKLDSNFDESTKRCFERDLSLLMTFAAMRDPEMFGGDQAQPIRIVARLVGLTADNAKQRALELRVESGDQTRLAATATAAK